MHGKNQLYPISVNWYVQGLENEVGSFVNALLQSVLYEVLEFATVTLLAPTDYSVENVTVIWDDDTTENHIFDGLWYKDTLLEMDGQYINSVNGKKWLVEVLGEDVFIVADGASPVAIDDASDILFENGVLDKILE